MFSKTSSKRIAKHLDESERVPFLLQLIAGFLCKLLVVSIPPVSLFCSDPLLSQLELRSVGCAYVLDSRCHGFSAVLLWFMAGYE